jgi:hypothetical protein
MNTPTVDRILKQQQAERQATDDARANASKATLLSKPSYATPPQSTTTIQSPQPEPLPSGYDKSLAKSGPASKVIDSLHTFKRKIGSTINPTHSDIPQSSLHPPAVERDSALPPLPPPKSSAFPTPGLTGRIAQRLASNTTVTPLSNICT